MSHANTVLTDAILAILPDDAKLSGKVLQIVYNDGFPHETDAAEYLVITNSGAKLAAEMVVTGTRSPMSARVQFTAFGKKTAELTIRKRASDGYCASVEVDFLVPSIRVL